MRGTDERMAAVGQRTRELKREQAVRNNWRISLLSIAAGLFLVVGTGLAMPGVMAQMDMTEHLSVSRMASMFSSGNAMGYVMIALLAFVLGVCVTILCVHLQRNAVELTARESQGECLHD